MMTVNVTQKEWIIPVRDRIIPLNDEGKDSFTTAPWKNGNRGAGL
jgi:hypothetical protein